MPNNAVLVRASLEPVDISAQRTAGLWTATARLCKPATLSGQDHLLALARVCVRPATIAILDEAARHLDPHAEAHAEHAYSDPPRDTMLIVIAHRIGSALPAKRILIMDGATPLIGTPRLLAVLPLYADRPRPNSAHPIDACQRRRRDNGD